MTDPIGWLVLVAGVCLIVIGGSRLGAGSQLSLTGLWAPQGRTDWPHGVQEGDAPRFAISHADALRPGTPVDLEWPLVDDHDDPRPEVIDLGDRPV